MEAPYHDGVDRSRPTWALRLGDGGEEGHEAGASEELDDKDGGVALRLGVVDSLHRREVNMRKRAVRGSEVSRREREARAERGERSGWFDSMRADENRPSERPKQSITILLFSDSFLRGFGR